MNDTDTSRAITPGLVMIHSNRMENLRDLLLDWCKQNPLPPLEQETILVQSNGIAQWLKHSLARNEGLGICAGVSFELPARFTWHLYRTVLTDRTIPETSPFDRAPLTWRIYQCLPGLLKQQPDLYAPLAGFLDDDSRQEKRYQLAEQLAGLYDQYQVHRPDWLQKWSNDPNHSEALPPEGQRWQAHLWQALLATAPESVKTSNRAFLHEPYLEALKANHSTLLSSGQIPSRLIVFGISSLPRQTLEAITALGTVSQVFFFVQNPCKHYWADLIEGRELLTHAAKRQARKTGTAEYMTGENLHLHGNPLLAAWGKQGRDFVRLLEVWDDPEQYRDWFQKIDWYDDESSETQCLLHEVQNAILNLDPLPATPEQRKPLKTGDDSIVFHVAHSPQREVEILHDQLLSLFDQPDTDRLEPRDVIVMVPDIDRYAPHIDAVFGQIAPDDARQIPYSLADQHERGHDPILMALEYLLNLPEARFTASEVLNLLDLSTIRHRFGLEAEDIPLIRRWIREAGIRWGLDGAHRDRILGIQNPAPAQSQNTWQFGLDRLLMGYSMGDAQVYNDQIAPYPGIGGLESESLGPLCLLLKQLKEYSSALSSERPPSEWGERLRSLLADFFVARDAAERETLFRLHQGLDQWLSHCEAADLTEHMPLAVVREAWLAGLDQPQLTQRFLTGRVNFCTLMPMRSIPFRLICLLGMNDGDFPRSQLQPSFDLMSRPGAYRPGDRARREDDRYMFLEAVLSARERLYLSWVGRSVRDNTHLPPSVLVQQLRDYLNAGWMPEPPNTELLPLLTVEHPLQPFNPAYFTEGDSRLFSYVKEWRAGAGDHAKPESLKPTDRPETLTLRMLQSFVNKPVRHFFNQRLGVFFDEDAPNTEDRELFSLNRLEEHNIGQQFIRMKLRDRQQQREYPRFLKKQSLGGELPLGGFGSLTQKALDDQAERVALLSDSLAETWGEPLDKPRPVSLSVPGLPGDKSITLEDWLTGLRPHKTEKNHYAIITYRPAKLSEKDSKTIKYHYLISLWVQHVAACASGLRLSSYLVGEDRIITLPPCDSAPAEECLKAIMTAWYAGIQEPLPVARKTAFAWLDAKVEEKDKKAREAYEGKEGDTHSYPERDTDAYLKRAYPHADDLLTTRVQGKKFGEWANILYAPVRENAQVMKLNPE